MCSVGRDVLGCSRVAVETSEPAGCDARIAESLELISCTQSGPTSRVTASPHWVDLRPASEVLSPDPLGRALPHCPYWITGAHRDPRGRRTRHRLSAPTPSARHASRNAGRDSGTGWPHPRMSRRRNGSSGRADQASTDDARLNWEKANWCVGYALYLAISATNQRSRRNPWRRGRDEVTRARQAVALRKQVHRHSGKA